MLATITTKRFEKDVVLQAKRGKDIKKLKKVMQLLVEQKSLPRSYKNHKLTGHYTQRMECHIEPDWLLVYRCLKGAIHFERTGSHSDLFK